MSSKEEQRVSCVKIDTNRDGRRHAGIIDLLVAIYKLQNKRELNEKGALTERCMIVDVGYE